MSEPTETTFNKTKGTAINSFKNLNRSKIFYCIWILKKDRMHQALNGNFTYCSR